MRCRRLLSAFSVSLAALAVTAAPAAAEDPLFVDWSSLLPAMTSGYDPTSEDECIAGKTQCVDKVIKVMTKRFDDLAADCDHDAVFALTYLRTTEEYRRTIEDPTFFEDTNFVNHEDAVFAAYYFDAYDRWHSGDHANVPEAWRIAFDAADNRKVSGAGNMLLGLSAHINRDLPYVLAGIGLVKPDGTSRKPDHDKVNEFLNRVSDTLMPELARRFDPAIDDGNLPTWLDDMLTFQSVPAMRENAWRNAERLANATTAEERALVEATIEAEAATTAQAIVTETQYGLLGSSAGRDAWCAEHWDDTV